MQGLVRVPKDLATLRRRLSRTDELQKRRRTTGLVRWASNRSPAPAGHRDDPRRNVNRPARGLSCGVVAIHARHANIEKHDVGLEFGNDMNSLERRRAPRERCGQRARGINAGSSLHRHCHRRGRLAFPSIPYDEPPSALAAQHVRPWQRGVTSWGIQSGAWPTGRDVRSAQF